VAPKHARDGVWAGTRNWVEPLLSFVSTQNVDQQISVVYELTWRLEIVLAPLFIDWAEKMQRSLESINPFPGLLDLREAIARPDVKSYSSLDWANLGEQWFSIGCVLATEARDDQDERRFGLWMSRLERIAQTRRDWQARLAYENCLFYLMRLDYDSVRRALSKWPEMLPSPFWETRRAAVLAELGDLELAEKTAETSLAHIRERLSPYSPDLALLSQEGWTMVLLGILKSNHLGQPVVDLDHYRDRWQTLSAYGCNPWMELDLLGALVRLPGPTPKSARGVAEDFDPGRTTVTYLLGPAVSLDQLIPAFALLRMLELGGLPMRAGFVTVLSEEVVRAADWIETVAPLASLCVRLRAGRIESMRQKLTRARVAILSAEQVGLLLSLSVQGAERTLREYQSGQRAHAEAGTPQLALFAEVLSRLAFRADIDERRHIFELALAIYALPLTVRFHLRDAMTDLFRRVLFAMTPSESIRALGDFLQLPMPPIGDSPILEGLPEPTQFIELPRGVVDLSAVDRGRWTPAIAKLIRIVREDTGTARQRALLRLTPVYEIGLLTETETNEFALALWERLDQSSGLPSDLPFAAVAVLDLPEPKDGIAKARLRAYLLRSDFRRTVIRSKTESGQELKQASVIAGPHLYLVNLVGATARKWLSDQSRRIDWTHAETLSLLGKVVGWWDEEKGEVEPSRAGFHVLGEPGRHLSELVPVIAIVILPRLRKGDEQEIASVERILSEAEASGIITLFALPSLLRLRPAMTDDVARRIRRGLNSANPDEVSAAANAIHLWLEESSLPKSNPEPPGHLLDELVRRFASRRQPGLRVVIETLKNIVEKWADVLSDRNLEDIYVGLEYVLAETELKPLSVMDASSRDEGMIPFEERPTVRAAAAALAAALNRTLVERRISPAPVLQLWQMIAQQDPLPEVRRAWREA